jgi:hypothetical protein
VNELLPLSIVLVDACGTKGGMDLTMVMLNMVKVNYNSIILISQQNEGLRSMKTNLPGWLQL